MNLPEIHALITRLEQSRSPFDEATHRPALENYVAELMDAIYEHPTSQGKMRLVGEFTYPNRTPDTMCRGFLNHHAWIVKPITWPSLSVPSAGGP